MLTVERSLEAAERHLVGPARARILPAGAIIVDAILEHYGRTGCRVSEEGIREGLVLARRGRSRLARPAARARARLDERTGRSTRGPWVARRARGSPGGTAGYRPATTPSERAPEASTRRRARRGPTVRRSRASSRSRSTR